MENNPVRFVDPRGLASIEGLLWERKDNFDKAIEGYQKAILLRKMIRLLVIEVLRGVVRVNMITQSETIIRLLILIRKTNWHIKPCRRVGNVILYEKLQCAGSIWNKY